ncbi:MAG: hypothetical protein ACRD1G_17365, partial [Acidimicrobiales bacterium]
MPPALETGEPAADAGTGKWVTPRGNKRGPRSAPLRPSLAKVWRTGCALFTLQLVGMIIWSWHLYDRFSLT